MKNNSKSVSFYTLGCKLNFSETSTIAESFRDAGYQEVPFEENSNVCVINTCSVTENADKKFYNILKKIKKFNPQSYVIVVGCYAQLKPNDISQIKGVNLVLGANEKFDVVNYFENNINSKNKSYSCEISQVNQFHSSFSIGSRTRGFLKVQDGCDYKCTYCTIPKARGVSRSDSIENILTQADDMVSKGVKEIVLTGVNIGDYGKGEFGNKKHNNTFLELLERIDKIKYLERIRISSIEPNLLTSKIILFIKNSNKLVPHFHIPLQSGCNKILGLMQRRYSTNLYLSKINEIKKLIPNACIGADVIVGFPGETKSDFLETYNFLKSLNISYLHVFSFSGRMNTKAYNMLNKVGLPEKNSRSKMLRILSTKKTRKFYTENKDFLHSVLFESENKNGFIYGYTSNYVRVKTYWDPTLSNKVLQVYIQSIGADGIANVKVKNEIYA